MGRVPSILGRCGLLVGAWALAACQVDGSTMDSGFYDPAASASTTATIPSQDTDAQTDDGSSGSDTEPGDSDGETSEGGSSTDGGSTGADATDTDGGTTDGATEQPAAGMYSECTSVVDCVGLTQCVTTDDGMDGFCSASCNAPAMDCDEAPGGTAPVVCAMMGGPSAVCALDCSVGQDCPTGMTCQTTSGGTFCI